MFFSFFIALLAGISVCSVDCLTCLDCTDIQSPRHCKYVMECQHGEVCNVHRTTNQYGDAVFNVGCVHPSACSNLSQGHQACDECCSTDVCNAAGCGMTGYPPKRGPVCYTCPAQIIDGTCHKIDVCGINEECMINEQSEFGDTVFTSQCVGSTHCERHTMDISQLVGRSISDDTRSLAETVCHKCCHDDLCNAHCGKDFCASNPCDYGTCINGQTNYTCVCDISHTGRNCADVEYCRPDPCEFGTCITTNTGYKCVCDQYYTGVNCSVLKPHGQDCLDIGKFIRNSGVYEVQPEGTNNTIKVFCDMTTDGGNWTVFQRRVNGSVDFYQNFSTYENGFGNVEAEFWLGLKYIHAMTSNAESELRIDLVAADGSIVYELFQKFTLSAAPNYKLHIDKGQGSAGDLNSGLSYHNGFRFSTYDNDDANTCSQMCHGAWWYNFCAYVNLNGRYVTPGTAAPGFNYGEAGVIYYDFKQRESLKETKMMFRRV